MNDTGGESSDIKEDEMICGLTLDERNKLRAALNALPETMPPRAVWRRIAEQAEAEGLLRDKQSGTRSRWYAGVG
ncbi:MAG TPA: hypothetical protein PKK10_18545, partial [Woeseiaceae bacterium]|nr:hypothetical protein [Woeseiaceae bacterium]